MTCIDRDSSYERPAARRCSSNANYLHWIRANRCRIVASSADPNWEIDHATVPSDCWNYKFNNCFIGFLNAIKLPRFREISPVNHNGLRQQSFVWAEIRWKRPCRCKRCAKHIWQFFSHYAWCQLQLSNGMKMGCRSTKFRSDAYIRELTSFADVRKEIHVTAGIDFRLIDSSLEQRSGDPCVRQYIQHHVTVLLGLWMRDVIVHVIVFLQRQRQCNVRPNFKAILHIESQITVTFILQQAVCQTDCIQCVIGFVFGQTEQQVVSNLASIKWTQWKWKRFLEMGMQNVQNFKWMGERTDWKRPHDVS